MGGFLSIREKIQVELSLQDFRSTHIMEEQLTQERSSVSYKGIAKVSLGNTICLGENGNKFIKSSKLSKVVVICVNIIIFDNNR